MTFVDIDERLRTRQGGRVGAEALRPRPERIGDPTVPIDEQLRQRQILQSRGIAAPNPRALAVGTREEFLRAQTPTPDVPLGPAGFDDPLTRADLSFSRTQEEFEAKFQAKFPTGQVLFVNEPPIAERIVGPGGESERFGRVARTPFAGTTVLFRRNPNEPFMEFDEPGFDLIGDLTDLAVEAPAAAVETAVTRGGNLASQLVRFFLAQFGTKAAQEAAEELRGFQRQTLPEIVQMLAVEGFVASAGGAATTIFTGPLNIVRGTKGMFAVQAGARRAQQAAVRQGFPGLLPSQIAQNPLIRRLGGQSAAQTSTVGQYVDRQNAALVQALAQMKDDTFDRFVAGDFTALIDQASEQIVEAARASRLSLTQGGSAIQAGIVQYDNLARAGVKSLYDRARRIATPDFDIAPAKAAAQRALRGIQGALAEGGTIRLDEIGPDVRAVAEDILRLDPRLPTVDGVSATDQLRALQQRLWDTATPERGQIRRASHVEAGKLLGSISHVLDNPGNADPGFVSAWAEARAAAKQRFDTMEKLIVVNATKSETPAQLASRLAQPLQVDNLEVLQQTLPAAQYGQFQKAVEADMISTRTLRDPSTGRVTGQRLRARLNELDEPTRRLLMSEQTERNLRTVADQMDELASTNIENVLARQNRAGSVIRGLVTTNDQRGIDRLVDAATTNPQLRETVAAGIVDDIWNETVTVTKNVQRVDQAALDRTIKQYKDTGAWKILPESHRRVLEDVQSVLAFIPQAADPGTSIAAATTTEGLREFRFEAFQTLIEVAGVARVMTSRAGQRLLVGAGREPSRLLNSAPLVGAIAASIANEVARPGRVAEQ